MKILVTGGSGLVGQYLREIRPEAHYPSSSRCDLTDPQQVEHLMEYYKPDVLIHMAAKVGGITSNIKHPVEYLEQNILMNTNVLKSAWKHKVRHVIALSSTCAYPDTLPLAYYPLQENVLYNGKPAKTNFQYAVAKRCLSAQIEAYRIQHGVEWACLIPCNLYGKYDKFGETSHYVSALIKKIYEAEEGGTIKLLGTGIPLRQFMYAEDLARAINLLLETENYKSILINIANPEIKSIEEIAKIAVKACGKEVKIEFDNNALLDGQYRKDVSSNLFLSTFGKGFNFTTLEEGIKKTYDYISKRYDKQ